MDEGLMYFILQEDEKRHTLSAIADAISAAIGRGEDVNEYEYFAQFGINDPDHELNQNEVDYIEERINRNLSL